VVQWEVQAIQGETTKTIGAPPLGVKNRPIRLHALERKENGYLFMRHR
jgi:hypothetical protein